MKISLYQRLAFSLLILFIAVVGAFSWWSQNLEQLSRSEAEQRLHISLAEHLANDNPQLKEGVYDASALENMFHTLMILGPSFEFYFIDPKGKILTYSAKPGKVKRQSISLKPLLQLIEKKQTLPIFGDDPRSFERQKIFSVSPIYNDKTLQGYLYVIIGGEIYDSIFSKIQSNKHISQSIGIVFGTVFFFFIVLLGLLRFLTLPLKELTATIRSFRQAGFDETKINLPNWPNADNNEIHELGRTFNQMATQINQQINQLKSSDQQRRELLTHLSHDLRTPLASLQGFLETVSLKNKELSNEQHQRFISIAFKNANQLKLLIDQIFELAHLEVGEVEVNLETFPVGELLHDIAAKFSLNLKNKNLSIKVEPKQCHFSVNSDIAKLERVLSNLIENAIRHSPQNGEILLCVQQKNHKKIRLSLTDSGTGIDKKELENIFNARYRATNAIDDGNAHSGLGLAISQGLMKLLNSKIHVISELNNGSTFYFDLIESTE